MGYRFTFPNGLKKALTFSYDDGTEYDRRLVDIFDHYHLKATFHLNTGWFGTSNECEEYIKADEVEDLYEGHEVSCHTYHHPFFSDLSHGQMVHEFLEDKRSLERMCRYPIRGMSYPFGEYFDEMVSVAKACGMEYSRTVKATGNFYLPSDFMEWNPTCHHRDMFNYLDAFLNPPAYRNLNLFYIWGHSFEYGREDNWDLIERFCKTISTYDDIWFATNIEIKDYITAARNLVSTADEDMIYNPSALTVWVETSKGKLLAVEPGATVVL